MATTEFIKYKDIERINHEDNKDMFLYPTDIVYIEEKVDGCNMSFWWDNQCNKLIFASRNQTLEDNGAGQFQNSVDFIKTRIEDGTILSKDLIYYIEGTKTHTITYDREKIPWAIGIDIRAKRCMKLGLEDDPGLYLEYDAKVKEFERINVPCVQLVKKARLCDIDANTIESLVPDSVYYNGKAEGIVIKNYSRLNVFGKQMFAKVVREEFKEINKATFGSLKHSRTDTLKIVDTYCTDARILKRIHTLITEGNLPLERQLMKYLPVAVIEDIFKEELRSILKFDIIELGTMKTLVAKHCLRILDEEIRIANNKQVE